MTSPPPSSAEARARWRAAAARVASVSASLGRRFEEHTASFVESVDPAQLDAFAEAGLALRAGGGWRGERLAQELFATARRALPMLAPADVGRWAELALRCGNQLDEGEVLRALPAAITGWDAEVRGPWPAGAPGAAAARPPGRLHQL